MKDKIILALFLVLCLIVLFMATVGIATNETNKNKALIDSLMHDVSALKYEVDEITKANKDTIVIDVAVKPQIIKIYNTCTN